MSQLQDDSCWTSVSPNDLPLGYLCFQILEKKTMELSNTRILEINSIFESQMKTNRETIINQPLSKFLPDSFLNVLQQKIVSEKKTDSISEPIEFHKTDTGKWFQITLYCPQEYFVICLFTDITGQKQYENILKKSNRALQAVHLSNQALIKAKHEFTLLNEICQIVIDKVGYRFAWIGYLNNDTEQSIRILAQGGIEQGYLQSLRISYADNEWGNGPVGQAIRSKKYAVCMDVQTDPRFRPWRQLALEKGFRSVIAFPLMNEDAVFGVFVIYGEETNAFAHEEIKILQELAEDLAFGITTLHTKLELAEYQRELEQKVDLRTKDLAEKNEFLIQELDENKKLTIENENLIKSLSESVRILQCIQNLSNLIELYDNTDDVLSQWPDLMLTGFSNPKHFSCRIKYKSKEYHSTDFQNSPQTFEFPLRIQGRECGFVELNFIASDALNEKISLLKSDNNLFELITQRLIWYIAQKELENQLFQQKMEFQTLIENDPDQIIRIDHKFHVLYLNPAAAEAIELNTPQSEIHSLDEIVFSDNLFGKLKDSIRNVLSQRKKITQDVENLVNKDSHWYRIQIIPEITPQNEIPTILLICSDINEHKKVEITLNQAKEIAESANKAKSDFIANISHELRTPLNSIIGFSEILIDEKIGPLVKDQIEILATMNESAHHLLALINDIIDISKIEAGKIEISSKAIRMNEIVSRMEVIFRERAHSNGLDFKLENNANQDQVMVDEVKLKQIYYNLLSNAIKFTETGGSVGIKINNTPTTLHIIIWDTGIGIDPINYSKLFSPFKRIPNRKVNKYPAPD